MATARHTHGSNASIGAGLLFGAGAAVLGIFSSSRPLVGATVYVAATLASLVLWYRADSEASASNDLREASPADTTLAVLGIASAVVFPGLVAADGLGYFTWTSLTAGIAFTVAGVYVVFGAVSLLRLFRSGKQ